MCAFKPSKPAPLSRDDAEAMALNCLGFLAEDPRRLTRFLGLTGIEPETLRENAGTVAVQQAALDYLLADESLLLVFAGHCGVAPQTIAVARDRLEGPQEG